MDENLSMSCFELKNIGLSQARYSQSDAQNNNVSEKCAVSIGDWHKMFEMQIKPSEENISEDISDNNAVPYNYKPVNVQFDPNISDIEKNLPTYVVGTISSQQPIPLDIQHNLEFVCVNSEVNSKQSSKRLCQRKEPPRTIPLLIEDIFKILFQKENNVQIYRIFDQTFSNVMFHGYCVPQNRRSYDKKNEHRYVVDDGTGKIDVIFNHGSDQIKCIRKAHGSLTEEHEIIKNERLTCAGQDQMSVITANRKSVVDNTKVVLDIIRKNISATINPFPLNSKVFVIGKPIESTHKKISFRAYEMVADNKIDRIMEVNFKKQLFNTYENQYFKRK